MFNLNLNQPAVVVPTNSKFTIKNNEAYLSFIIKYVFFIICVSLIKVNYTSNMNLTILLILN